MEQKEIKISFIGIDGINIFNRWKNKKKDVKVIEFENPRDADYIILSANRLYDFKDACSKYRDKILISYTGEALSPDFNMVDYAIAFDPISYEDRYCKAPMHLYAEFNKKKDGKKELAKKVCFCNFIFSQKKAHPNRDNFFFQLCEYKKVDSLGEHLRNVKDKKPTRRGNWFQEGIKEKSPYKFSISFENATAIGYTTEKIITSMLANSIPIYWGDPEVSKYYNPKSFINYHDYNSFEAMIAKVKELDKDDKKYAKMLSQPWQTKSQQKLIQKEHKNFEKFMDNIFLTPYDEAFRKPVGTWENKYKAHLYGFNRFMINLKKFRSNLFYIKFKKHKKSVRILGITFLNK